VEEMLTWKLEEIPAEQTPLALAVVAAIGIVYCFVGYRFFKLILALTGFSIAGLVAAAITGWLTEGNLMGMAIAFGVGGICGAFALHFLYKVGVFLLGIGGALPLAYNALNGREEAWAPWAIIGVALCAGILALLIERPIMTLATATLGGWLIAFAGALLFMGTAYEDQLADPEKATWVYRYIIGAWGILTLLGAAIQFSGQRKKEKREHK
jgi:hypothetical protein